MHAITTVKLYNAKNKKWGEYDLYTRQNYNINFSTYSERGIGFKREKKVFSVLIIDRHTSYSA